MASYFIFHKMENAVILSLGGGNVNALVVI